MNNEEVIQNFAPYCVGRNARGKFDLKAGFGIFLIANAVVEIQKEKGEYYLKKDSWFQKMCLDIMNKTPTLSPLQAEELSIQEELKQ